MSQTEQGGVSRDSMTIALVFFPLALFGWGGVGVGVMVGFYRSGGG